MSYVIELDPKVERYLNKLQKDISLRIIKKLKQIKENPFHYLEHYESDNYYKLRIGDYRALIEVDNQNEVLFVRVLDKRNRIYKK